MTSKDDDTTGNENTASPPTLGLRFDWQDWLPYFEDEAIPDDQKQELIETLWAIVTAFVDMGWSLNPTQQICGQDIDLKAVLEQAVLASDFQETRDKEDAA